MTRFLISIGASAAAMLSCQAAATPISFDCDVPANRYSSVSQDMDGSSSVGGTVKLVAGRPGKFLPVAGARLVSPDGNVSAGIQIIASGPSPSRFDVVLNLDRNGDLKRYAVGQVDAKSDIVFKLSSEGDKVALLLGDKSILIDFVPVAEGKMTIFCSTAQFKFSNVVFGASTPRQ